MTFRSRVFVTALVASALALGVAMALVSYRVRSAVSERIERSLVSQARLAAERCRTAARRTPEELDAEADRSAAHVRRVTFRSRRHVIGDSELSATALRAAENHAGRPEVVQAARDGFGVSRRYSTTIGTDMLYVAVPVKNAAVPELAQVRLALPLTDVSDQLQAVRQAAIAAAFVGLVAALLLAWAASGFLSKRVRAIADVAKRYAAGDLTRPARDYGSDEIGTVARALDDSVREIGRRAAALTADRARMEAILSGWRKACWSSTIRDGFSS